MAVCVRTATGHVTEVAVPHRVLDAQRGGRWDKVRINIAVNDRDTPETPVTQLWWRPDWRSALSYPDSGTFARAAPAQ